MDFNKQNILTNKQNFINPRKFKTMKNLILTICLSAAVSFSFAQIDVVGPDGNVGMGVTNPTKKLDVGGDVKIRGANVSLGADNGFEFRRTASGSSRFYHYGTGQYQFRAENNTDITFWTRAINRGAFKANGRFEVYSGAYKPGGGNWAALSDENLKTNIVEFTDGLNEIMKIEPVTYNYNEKTNFDQSEKHVGIVAQDIQKIAPYMVSDFDLVEHTEETVNKKGTFKSVDPSAFTYMLINAVKEQQQIIESQNESIENLQQSVSQLAEKIEMGYSSSILLEGDRNIAKLAQNTPNPLTDITNIEYYIPSNSQEAVLQIHDLGGKVFKTINIGDKGTGSINVKVKDLASGLYTYTLKIDGKLIDTKKMIIK